MFFLSPPKIDVALKSSLNQNSIVIYHTTIDYFKATSILK
jgi:hypothetical protein